MSFPIRTALPDQHLVEAFLRDHLASLDLPRSRYRPTAISARDLFEGFKALFPMNHLSAAAFGMTFIKFYNQPWFPFSEKEHVRTGQVYHLKTP